MRNPTIKYNCSKSIFNTFVKIKIYLTMIFSRIHKELSISMMAHSNDIQKIIFLKIDLI